MPEQMFSLADNVFSSNFLQSSETESPNFDRLYIFGDSLSDNGNESIGLNYIQDNLNPDIEIDAPSPPYSLGRESNGLIWTDYLAKGLGLYLKPVLQLSAEAPVMTNSDGGYEIVPSFTGNTVNQSVNFAFSGARLVDDDLDPGDLATPSVSSQVDLLLNDSQINQASLSENGLYVVQGGANDYLSGDFSEPNEPVASIADSITELYDAGARYFLVPNLPDLGNTPIGSSLASEESVFLTNVSSQHNDLLRTTLSQLERDLPDIKIEAPDFRALVLDIANDPTAFDFTNGTDAYLVGEAPDFSATGDNSDDYFYWDYIHPTTKGQDLLADLALQDVADLSEEESSYTIGNYSHNAYSQFEFQEIREDDCLQFESICEI